MKSIHETEEFFDNYIDDDPYTFATEAEFDDFDDTYGVAEDFAVAEYRLPTWRFRRLWNHGSVA